MSSQYSTSESVLILNDTELMDIFDTIDFNENIDQYQMQIPENVELENKCVTCKVDDYLIEDTAQGQLVCTQCGQVVNLTLFDTNPEWKTYGDNPTTVARCSTTVNVLLPQSSINTTIAGSNYNPLKQIQTWNSMPYKEKIIIVAFKEIHEMCAKATLLKCIEDDAKILYKKLRECKHVSGKKQNKDIISRGVNRKGLMIACIFFACKRKKVTRSPKELALLYNIKYTEVTKGCKHFLEYMRYLTINKQKTNIKKPVQTFALNTHQMISEPVDFIDRFCTQLQLNTEYNKLACQLAKNVQKLNIASDHTPYSIASASILLMSDYKDLHLSKKHLSTTLKVSEVTIFKTYTKLAKYKDILLNDDLINKISTKLNRELLETSIPQKLVDRYNNIINYNNLSIKDQNIKLEKSLMDLDQKYQQVLSEFKKID